MGQGDAGRDPLILLRERFSMGGDLHRDPIEHTKIFRKLYRVHRVSPENNVVIVLLDIVQTIESCNWKDYETGHDMYLDVKKRIITFLKIPGVKIVCVCMDCSKNENLAKEMVYYTLTGARRKGIVPMAFRAGDVVIDDNNFPTENWKEFKMCKMARRQLNYYISKKLSTESEFFDGVEGSKEIVFDNCIRKENLFYPCTENDVPYHCKRISIINGQNVGVNENLPATCIAEAEYAMFAWNVMFQDELAKQGQRPCVCINISTDQDMASLAMLGQHDRKNAISNFTSRVFLLLPTWHYEGKKGSPDRKKIDETTVIDVNKLVMNITNRYSCMHNIHSAVLACNIEAFLFLIGGCDNMKKMFYRIGYKSFMYKEFVENLTGYARMFKMMYLPACEETDSPGFGRTLTPSDDGDDHLDQHISPNSWECLVVDFQGFKEYAKAVKRRKKKTCTTTEMKEYIEANEDKWYVKVRQIMYTMLFMRMVPVIRSKFGMAATPSPYLMDCKKESVWGYTKGVVDGGPTYPVTVSAHSVSRAYFG